MSSNQRELEQKVRDGEFIPLRENDILTIALGNPEHRGRTRGVGATVGWGKGLQGEKPKRKARSKVATGEELNIMQTQISSQQEQISSQQQQIELLKQQIMALSQRPTDQTDQLPSPPFKRSSHASNIIADPLESIKVFTYNSILNTKCGHMYIQPLLQYFISLYNV